MNKGINLEKPPEQQTKVVEIYVCWHPDCSNYYGTSGMEDLSKAFTGPKVENARALEETSGSPHTHTRAECPDCRNAGRGRVMRSRIRANVVIKREQVMRPPELPPSSGRIH